MYKCINIYIYKFFISTHLYILSILWFPLFKDSTEQRNKEHNTRNDDKCAQGRI